MIEMPEIAMTRAKIANRGPMSPLLADATGERVWR